MDRNKKHWALYILKLEQDKWYVGITTQAPEARFREHLYGRKSYWTAKYPPIEMHDTKDLGVISKDKAEEFEERVTRKYMQEKGLNNVRGGKLTSTSDYVIAFGRIYDKIGWQAAMVFLFLSIVLLFAAMQIFLLKH